MEGQTTEPDTGREPSLLAQGQNNKSPYRPCSRCCLGVYEVILTKTSAMKWGMHGFWIVSVNWSRALSIKTARLPLQRDSPACWILNPGGIRYKLQLGNTYGQWAGLSLQTLFTNNVHWFHIQFVFATGPWGIQLQLRNCNLELPSDVLCWCTAFKNRPDWQKEVHTHKTLEAQCVCYIELSREAVMLHTAEQGSGLG